MNSTPDIRRLKCVRQAPLECAPAALAMGLSMVGLDVGEEAIRKTVPKDLPKWREWLYWMGVYALGAKCKAEMLTNSTQVFDPTWRTLNGSALRKKLTAERVYVKKVLAGREPEDANYRIEHFSDVERAELDAAIRFLDAGGKIRLAETTPETIAARLKTGWFALASLDGALLYKTRRGLARPSDIHGTTWGHVVLVLPGTAKTFRIVDPADWYEREQMFDVPRERLVEAVLRRDQNVLFIRRA